MLKIVKRYDKATKGLEDEAIERFNASLSTAYTRLEKELRRNYPRLQTQGSLTVLQRKLLLADELSKVLDLLPENQVKPITKQFQETLKTASATGGAMADELIAARNVDYGLKDFADIPVEAVAAQARDGVKRLYRHAEDFRNSATAIVEQGLIQGWGAAKVAREMRSRLAVTKSKAAQIARTEMSAALNTAAQERYQKQGVEYVQWFITPSQNVCQFCAARNGNVYKAGTVILPAHPSDRCVLLPWRKQWQALELTDDTFINDYHAKGIADLKARGLKPNYGVTPFERAAKLEKAPEPLWKPGDPAVKSTPPKPKPSPKPAPEPKRTPEPKKASKPKKEVMIGAKPAGKVKPIELPQIKGSRDFDEYLRAHVIDMDEIDNLDGIIDLNELQKRMALHGVSERKFKSGLLSSYDDTFALTNNPSNKAMSLNGLERSTLTINDRLKFKSKPIIEEWHKSQKGLVTKEVIDSQEGFRAAAGSYLDKQAKKNGNYTEIHKLRSHLGDRVTKREFNDWMLEWQTEDDFQMIVGGEVFGASREDLANSLKIPGGATRFYVVKSKLDVPLNPLNKNFAPVEKPEGYKAFIQLGKRRNQEFYDDFESVKARLNADIDAAFDETTRARKALMKDSGNKDLQAKFLAAERAELAINDNDRIGKALEKPFEKLRQRLIEKGDAAQAKDWAQLQLNITDKALKEQPEKLLRDAMEEFHRISRGKVSNTLDTLDYVRERAFADKNGFINIGRESADTAVEVLFHEAGHHLEYADKRFFDAADEWMQARATGPAYKSANGETYLQGEFLDKYVSRQYYYKDGARYEATEVISMGMEHFSRASDLKRLFAQDREMFEFILGVLESD